MPRPPSALERITVVIPCTFRGDLRLDSAYGPEVLGQWLWDQCAAGWLGPDVAVHLRLGYPPEFRRGLP